jgi:hypothetical protein
VGTTVGVAIAAAVAAAVLIHPWAALAAAPLAALTVRSPRVGRYLPVALVALAAAQIVWYQTRNNYELDRDWAQHFPGAHLCAYVGILLLGIGAAWDLWGRRTDRDDREGAEPSLPQSAGDDDLSLEEIEEGTGRAVPREPVGVGDRRGTETGT